VLDGLVERMEFRDRLRDYAVFPIWDEEVGPEIACRTEPLRIEDGRLFVAVDGSAWMQELHFLKDEIRERLNRRLGAAVVREVFLVLGRAGRERRTPPPEGARSETPVDDAALAALVPSTGRPDLDAALLRIARARARRLGSRDE
jgi:predicted nucleic acid-binding Zn ribbon protein